MTLHDRHSDDAEATRLADLLRAGAEQRAPQNWQAAGLERLLRSASVVEQVVTRKRRWHAVTLAAAACVLVVAGTWFARSERTAKVTFEVQGADLSNHNYVVAPADKPAHMKFSDGSTVDLVQSTRLRVQQVTPRGASLVLERGTAMTRVVHHADSTWRLLAGPFEIAVIGTRFQAAWDPISETLKVDLYEGTLQIGGQRTGETAVLKSGQRFHAVGHKANWSISPIDAGTDAPAETTAEVTVTALPSAAIADQSAPVGGTGAVQVAPVRAARDWAAALAKGEFSRVIAEAEARGFANCLDQCSTADVRYLADAARYTRRFELAEQALVTLRRRSSGEAPAAAYLLGVVNESQGRNSAALRWYEQCASEAPRGRYVSEAQAGRLRMLVATGQYETARAAAVRYLKDFPRGVGEATAKKILSD
jgi:hypothetical protein